jgi:GntR family transcriptional repressor for pyruvate dehydrogenase complex
MRSAGFERIEQVRAHEYVAEQIRRQITLRLIASGEPLPPERQLASIFGVGRATVQAAIRLLEAERLVETRRGRNGGSFVTAVENDSIAKDYLLVRLRRERGHIEDALVFRQAVETFGAELAARSRRASELADIRSAAQRSADADTDQAFMAEDTELHLAIARAARNEFVYQAVEVVRLALNDALTALPESKLWQERSTEQHAGIVAAIERRDPGGAADAMRRHLAATEQSVRALLAAL